MSTRPAPATVVFAHRGGQNGIRGSEQCLLDLLAGLDRDRFRPFLICEQTTVRREAEAIGVVVEQLRPEDDWGTSVPRARRAVRARVSELLLACEAKLVHANSAALVRVLLPVVRRQRIPVLAHLHVPATDRYLRLLDLVHQADRIVGVAEHIVRPFRDDGVTVERLRVVYNAVSATRVEAGDAVGLREVLGIPSTAFVAGSAGALIHRKGHDVSVRAIARARLQGVDVRLLICGDPEDAAPLRALIAELGLGDVVHLLGRRNDVGAVLRDATNVCVTSAREEALGLNVLEAQWLGVPVIASDVAGHREALVEGRTGVLVPPEDPAALAEALAALARDPARRSALGEAGQAFARRRFAMARYVGEFEQLYTELLARPARESGWLRAASWPRAYTTRWGTWFARGVRNTLRRRFVPG